MAFETDESGAVSQASLYQPYGASLKDSNKASEKVSTYSFSGKEEDGSGLYYFEARYYDPVTTRFVSPDPLFAVDMEKCIESIIECNLYQYTGNNPVNFVDPDGMEVLTAGLELNAPVLSGVISGAIGLFSDRDVTGIEGISVELNVSIPMLTPDSKWGVGISIDGVFGGDAGTEYKNVSDKGGLRNSVKNFIGSLVKTSLMG